MLSIDGKTIHFIGDPHLGRTFSNVLPKHRGVKEAQLRDKFLAELATDADYILILGDLFDKFKVSNSIVIFVAEAIEAEHLRSPEKIILLNKGNHDESRDINKKSSYQILKRILDKKHLQGKVIVADENSFIQDGIIGVVPWHPFNSPKQMVEELPLKQLPLIITHNDVSDYGNKDHAENLMAFNSLKARTKLVVNGHVHQPSIFYWDGEDKVASTFDKDALKVQNWGSMLPLNFAEDKTGEYYVTLTLEEFNKLTDFSTLLNKSVRVVVKSDEEVPEIIDCIQFNIKRVSTSGTDEEETVEFEDFDLKRIYDKETEGLDNDELRKRVWDSLGQKVS